MSHKKFNFTHDPETYLISRPPYPRELFQWISSLPRNRGLALDCGTGPGNVINELSHHFKRCIGLDLNFEHLKQADRKDNIIFANSSAESLPIQDQSVDLLTVACSIHWFNIDLFYQEVKRVLSPDGVICVWTYGWPAIANSKINEILNTFRDDIVGNLWPEEVKLYLTGLSQLDFPFKKIESPDFTINCHNWRYPELLQFINSMSGPQAYIEKYGNSPTDLIKEELEIAWEHANICPFVNFPIYIKVGTL